jgi:hypothetical protein
LVYDKVVLMLSDWTNENRWMFYEI